LPETPGRILVVDDDDPVRDLEAAILQQAGFSVETAADGAIAIEFLKKERPVIVMLDLVMPNVDGWGVLEFVRTMADPPPVVVVSGMREIVPPGHLSQYVTGYVFKPFDVNQLVKTVRQTLAAPPVIPASGSRREPRRTFIVETTLLSDAGIPLAMGQLLQLSRGGFRLELAIPYRTGDKVRVTCRIPGQNDPLTLRGKVRWRQDLTLGVEIDDLEPKDEELLKNIVDPDEPPPGS
jgi:CheY-like chemotaxis protein